MLWQYHMTIVANLMVPFKILGCDRASKWTKVKFAEHVSQDIRYRIGRVLSQCVSIARLCVGVLSRCSPGTKEVWKDWLEHFV